MSGHVYLIKKSDLYLIGKATNLEKKMNMVAPDKIIATLKTEYPLAFEARLLRRYRHSRLPDSGYFSFNENQLIDCKKQFGENSSIPRTLGEEFFIALTASILLFFISLIGLVKLDLMINFSLLLSLSISSLPMFLLLFLGNFGGYNCSDLSIFSSWHNRIRALISLGVIFAISYFTWSIPSTY